MKTILIIESNEDIRENLREYFEIEGFKVIQTQSGRTGIEFAQQFTPDLILCNLLIPGMSGHEVLKWLSRTERTSGIPFIFSTVVSDRIDREKSLDLGADDYIIMPYELNTLLEMVNFRIASGKSADRRLMEYPVVDRDTDGGRSWRKNT